MLRRYCCIFTFVIASCSVNDAKSLESKHLKVTDVFAASYPALDYCPSRRFGVRNFRHHCHTPSYDRKNHQQFIHYFQCRCNYRFALVIGSCRSKSMLFVNTRICPCFPLLIGADVLKSPSGGAFESHSSFGFFFAGSAVVPWKWSVTSCGFGPSMLSCFSILAEKVPPIDTWNGGSFFQMAVANSSKVILCSSYGMPLVKVRGKVFEIMPSSRAVQRSLLKSARFSFSSPVPMSLGSSLDIRVVMICSKLWDILIRARLRNSIRLARK